MIKKILLLGNPDLYLKSEPVAESEDLSGLIQDLHDTLMDFLDDCMSFPGLYVKVLRHKKCTIKYLDENREQKELTLEDSLSELLQHEYDHLDGILATMRAMDNKSFL